MTAVRPALLVTGSSGLLGSVLAARLRARFEIRGLDRVPPHRPDAPEGGTRVVPTATVEDVAAAAAGAAAIVHLAGAAALESTWVDVLADNIDLTRVVLDGAVSAGVERVVLASSNHVTGLFERDQPYRDVLDGRHERLRPDDVPLVGPEAPLRPDSHYGVSKVAVEALGRMYAELHGLRVVCLRIGSVLASDEPPDARRRATWCSQRDFAGFVDAALRCDRRFEIAYCVSDNRWRIWALSDALDYAPVDAAERRRR